MSDVKRILGICAAAVLVLIVIALISQAIHPTPPVNNYGDSAAKATVRQQYTNEAQATIDAQRFPQPTPIRVRIVP